MANKTPEQQWTELSSEFKELLRDEINLPLFNNQGLLQQNQLKTWEELEEKKLKIRARMDSFLAERT